MRGDEGHLPERKIGEARVKLGFGMTREKAPADPRLRLRRGGRWRGGSGARLPPSRQLARMSRARSTLDERADRRDRWLPGEAKRGRRVRGSLYGSKAEKSELRASRRRLSQR